MKRMICMVLVFALIAAPSALAEGHRYSMVCFAHLGLYNLQASPRVPGKH